MRPLIDRRWKLIDGEWYHRPWWKVAINSVLRFVQPWSYRWVVYTRTTTNYPGLPPRVRGYGFGRVHHRRRWVFLHWLMLAYLAELLAHWADVL